MSQRNIDFGSFPNDPSADAIRTAFQKVQENFTELYAGQEAQAVLSVNKTPGAGIEVFPKTGNVVVSAKIACVRIQSSTLGLGAGSGNTASSAIIVSGTTPIIIDIPETLTNVANIRLTNTITANFATINANISTGNLVASSNISATNILSGNINVTTNANISQLNATTGTFAGNVSAANYTGTNITLTGDLSTVTGNVNAARATISGNLAAGNANLGNVAIANYFVGDGSLLSNVVSAANSLIQLGTSNVKIPTANGNVTMSVDGTANVMVVSNVGSNITGTLGVSGNTSLGNLTTNIATITTGNITTINSSLLQNGNSNVTLTANGNVTINAVGGPRIIATSSGANITGTLGVSSNANVGNLGTAGLVTATGNVSGGNLTTSGAVAATGNVSGGNITTIGQLVSSVATGTAPLKVTSTTVVPNLFSARANVSEYANVANQSTGTYYPTFVSGNSAGNYALASNIAFSANIANGALSATTFVGNLSGAASSATTAGTVTANAQPNITSVGNLSSLLVTGNTQSGNFIGTLASGTSNVGIPTTSGNINLSVGNIANVMVVTSSGVNVTGTLNATGNANVGNLGTSGLITATGNITGGNLITSGVVTATGNVSGGNLTTTGALAVTGNANVGNLGTSGLITATGNITGGNLTTTGALAVTGNANVGNLGTSGLIIATGDVSGGNLTTSGAVAATGNVSGGNLTTTGALAVTGNANVGNLGTSGLIIATGNVSGNNITTAGLVVANGNISGGNVNTSGKVTARTLESNVVTGTAPFVVTSTTRVPNLNVANAGYADSAGSATSATNASAVLNNTQISGTYYPTFISSTANGNYSLTSNGAFSANIANGFFGAPLIGGSLTTAAQPNITSVGTLTSLGVTGNVTAGNASLGNAVAANYFVGDGGLLSNITVSTGSFIVNGTSNVVVDLDGNVRTSVSGNANVLVVTNLGVQVTGSLSANSVAGTTLTGNLTTAAQPNITSLGNLTSLSVTGVANLGSNSNVKITGGVLNQFLITDGSGNLSWVTPAGLTVAPGSNTQILFNDAGSFAAASLFTYNKTTGNANVGNIGAGSGVFTSIAGNLTTAAQPNITSLGVLTSLTVNGNIAAGNITVSSGTLTGRYLSVLSGTLTASTPAANITQTWNNASASFTAIAANITDTGSAAGSKLIELRVGNTIPFSVDKTGVISGNGSGLTSIPASNISGSIAFANSATNAAAVAQSVSSANLVYPTFTASNAAGNSAMVVNNNIRANLANASITATTFVGNLSGAATSASTAGTVTTNAQPNITSVGNLAALTVTGNLTLWSNVIAVDNISINGFQGANGDGESGGIISLLAGNGGATGNTLGGQISLTAGSGAIGGNINLSPGLGVGVDKQGGTLNLRGGRGTGAGQPGNIIFQTADTTTAGNTVQTLANRIVISGNVVNVVTNISATSTSTGALRVVGGMGVGGNVYAGAFYGPATGLTSIPGGNVSGTVANATYATSAGSATTATSATNAAAILTNTQSSGTYYPAFVSSNANGNYSLSSNSSIYANFTTGTMYSTAYIGNLYVSDTNFVTTVNKFGIDSGYFGNTATTSGTVTFERFRGNINTYTEVANGDRLGQIEFLGWDSLQSVEIANITSIVDATYTAGTQSPPGAITFATGNASSAGTPSERMRIASTGNVGIANADPNHTLSITGTLNVSGNANLGNLGTSRVFASANITAPQLISNVATGTAPLSVQSTTLVANLNADLLDGYNSSVTATANTIAVRDANGNVAANYFVGNGSQLTGIITSVSNISNGTSKVDIPVSNGNVAVSVGGTSNIVVVTSNSAIVNGLTYTKYASQGYSTPTISAGTLTIDLANGTVFGVTLDADITTLNISNVLPAGQTSSFVLQLTGDGNVRTITWPSSFKWPDGMAPDVTSTLDKVTIIVAYSIDGGTNWFSLVSGQNL